MQEDDRLAHGNAALLPVQQVRIADLQGAGRMGGESSGNRPRLPGLAPGRLVESPVARLANGVALLSGNNLEFSQN